MIDFRYHLVSLISVFLALAVGVVLGAGPLRESLGTQLAGQVEQLRTEKDELRAENATLSNRADDLASYIAATAPTLVAGSLTDVSVGVITDDTSTRDDIQQATTLVDDAGGSVPVRITLGTRLWDPAQDQARADAVAALRSAAPSLTLNGDDDVQRLAGAVATVLSAPATDLANQERSDALSALTSAQIVSVEGTLDGPVGAVLYAGADPSSLAVKGDEASVASERAQAVLAAQSAIMRVLAERDLPAVVAGSGTAEDSTSDVVEIARSDSHLSALSTVDGFEQADGPAVAVLALGEQVRGGAGSYGTGTDARARVPGSSGAATSDGGGG